MKHAGYTQNTSTTVAGEGSDGQPEFGFRQGSPQGKQRSSDENKSTWAGGDVERTANAKSEGGTGSSLDLLLRKFGVGHRYSGHNW